MCILCHRILLLYQTHLIAWTNHMAKPVPKLMKLISLDRIASCRLVVRPRGRYYFRLGFTYFYMGNGALATQHVRHALAAAQRCADVATMGQAYYLLSLQGHRSGDFLQGIEYGRQAVALLEETQEWHWLGLAQWVLSRSYADIGAFDAALAAAAQAAAIGTASGDPRLESFAAWSSGVVHSM